MCLWNFAEFSKRNLYQVTALTHSSGDIDPPVGVFTAQDRPVWSSIRDQLISIDSLNHQTLEKIQSALMVVVLDSSSPTTYEEVRIFQEFFILIYSRLLELFYMDLLLIDGLTNINLLYVLMVKPECVLR